MKVNKVSATIRFSKEVHEGWKSVELGAEAALDPEDDWFLTQQGLYASLTGQLRTLWGKNGALEHVPEGSTIAVQPPQEEPHYLPIQQHYCEIHQSQFKKFEKNGQVWWSHKAQDGQWCRER
jgi:hypothetical protein